MAIETLDLAIKYFGVPIYVYHEIGHNWDAPDENKHVPLFRAYSGWKVSELFY